MNANYLLAGTMSTNPTLFAITTLLVLAWKTAGWGVGSLVAAAAGHTLAAWSHLPPRR